MSRLFVALRPPADVITALAEACEPMTTNPPDGLRVAPSGQWHVTLRFLGNADSAAVTRCLGAVDLPSCVAELDSSASVMGRVVIFGVSGVEALADAVHGATKSLGQPAEHRDFRGHVTVGRISRHAPVSAVRARLASDDIAVRGPSLHWRPGRIELVASRTEPSGAVHEVLNTFAMGR